MGKNNFDDQIEKITKNCVNKNIILTRSLFLTSISIRLNVANMLSGQNAGSRSKSEKQTEKQNPTTASHKAI